MSSFRSHFRQHVPPQHGPTTHQQKPSSRIPTKPGAADGSDSTKTAPQASRLAKNASKGTARVPPSPVSKSQDPATQSRRTSVAAPASLLPRHHALAAPPVLRTPSLVSGSSASTFDSPQSIGLRRKPSSAIDRYAAQRRTDSAADQSERRSRSAFDDTVLGISFPRVRSPDVYDESMDYPLGPYDKQSQGLESRLALDNTAYIPPPSVTPSTRYTDSPFSHAPTPSSASSYSPAIFATSRDQPSPQSSRSQRIAKSTTVDDRPRLGMPPVRESSTSSGSTVQDRHAQASTSHKGSVREPLKTKVPVSTSRDVSRSVSKHKLTKSPPTNKTAAHPVQVPPEFAHLNVVSPKHSASGTSRPSRPSRDNTPDLVGMAQTSPVVQSDLPHLYTTYHKRTPSLETPVSRPSSSLKTRLGLSPKESLRGESPRIDSAISPPPAARHLKHGPPVDIPLSSARPLTRQDSPAISASPSKSSRFGFFTRKSKTEVAKPVEKPKRAPSKGPAAGTGHEGYGRFGIRGRSGSSTSSTGFRSPSQASQDSSSSYGTRPRPSRQNSLASKDGSELDDFLRERLNPVILRGSGVASSTASSTSDMIGPSLDRVSSNNSSSFDNHSRWQLPPPNVREAKGSSPRKRPVMRRAQPSDSSDDAASAHYPALAARRSSTRLSDTSSRSPTRAPPPINTNVPRQQGSMDSYDAETSAWPRSDSTIPPFEDTMQGREGMWLRSPDPTSAKPARKLNFFQRALASPRPRGKEKAAPHKDVRNSVSHPSPSRRLAHYAMVDPVEPVGLDELGSMVQDHETSAEDSTSERRPVPKMVPYESRHVSLLPMPPKAKAGQRDLAPPRITVERQGSSPSPELLRAKTILPQHGAHIVDIPRSPNGSRMTPSHHVPDQFSTVVQSDGMVDLGQIPFGTPELGGCSNSPKQPRLSPIGRIPKVVSKRDRDRKLPDASFSRPFARTQPRPSVKPPGSVYNQIREMASPIESSSQPQSSTSTHSGGNSGEFKSSNHSNTTGASTNRTSIDIHHPNDFLGFPRKNSDQSYSTSSTNASWMNGLYAPVPQQEDVWNEYNDFIDEVIPHHVKTPTTGSSLGAPFQYANALYDPYNATNFPTLSGPAPTVGLPSPPGAAVVQTVLSVPQQISRFLHASLSPMTPDTLAAFVGGYGNRSTSTLYTSHRTRSGVPQPLRSSLVSVGESAGSSRHSRSSTHSRAASLPETNVRNSQSSALPSGYGRESHLADIMEVDDHKLPRSGSLRRGALLTSKWLSMGRVLFSPAHNEIQLTEEPRILVVDGLSSDWSYYVALSYPSAIVYDLSLPSALSEGLRWPDGEQHSPSNHGQIRLASLAAAFPFPKGFFTAVVFRFPNATTEQAYQACISECKRVLRPGGFLEVAVLDLDLMNMSAKARKAVRDLKTRMQSSDRDVCLGNLSDVLVRLIGRRGFDEVQRCIVGIPAAGRIPRSRDGSSVSSDSSGRPVWRREDHGAPDQEDFSFAGLLDDSQTSHIGPGKRNDESITKMVAKVGRWWYSACYERSLLPGDRSIWTDRALLRECEQQGTSFRLLICHAQKPAQTRRRTVSV